MNSVLTPQTLEQFGRTVQWRYPTINWGGCCVFASLMAAHIAKRFPTTIRVENYNPTNIDRIRPYISSNDMREWNSQGLHFRHVVVAFIYHGQKYFYDTRACATVYDSLAGGVLADGSLTVSEATELANGRGWNPDFNRAIIPELTKMIDQFFATIH